MTQDGVLFLQWFFQNIWHFFTDWKIPGTGVTPAGWLLFLLLAPMVLYLIQKLLGVSWFK